MVVKLRKVFLHISVQSFYGIDNTQLIQGFEMSLINYIGNERTVPRQFVDLKLHFTATENQWPIKKVENVTAHIWAHGEM